MGNCERRPIVFEDTPPKWFEATAGFRFRDPDGDIVMVVGEGGWRDVRFKSWSVAAGENNEVIFHPWTLVGVFNYKGEWHLCDLTKKTAKYWSMCRSITPQI